MTIQITSPEHGLEISNQVFRILNEVNADGGWYLAGGYLRDVELGVQPKDMDFFSHVANEAAIAPAVAAISERLGHTFKQLGNLVGEEYPIGFVVYESDEKPEGHFPVNLIFSVAVDFPPFDLGICQVYQYGPNERPYRSEPYKRDIAEHTITVTNWNTQVMGTPDVLPGFEALLEATRANARKSLAHTQRIMAKYPTFQVQLSTTALPPTGRWAQSPALVNAGITIFQEAGLLGNPRTLLPTQGPIIEGDAVGLEDRAEDLEQAEARTARREIGGEWLDRAIQAARDRVHNPAQVQPRPVADLAFFDDVERAAARERALEAILAGGGLGDLFRRN